MARFTTLRLPVISRALAQVSSKNNVLVIHTHTRLTVNGLLEGFPKKGDSSLSEADMLCLHEQIRSHQIRKHVLFC
jgi:hypothetical protein